MPGVSKNISRKIDIFGLGVKFLIDGEETLKTNTGAIVSLIAYICVAAYGAFEAFNLYTYNSTNYTQTLVTNYFSQSDVYYPVNNVTG